MSEIGLAPARATKADRYADQPDADLISGDRYDLPDPYTGQPRKWTRASGIGKRLEDTSTLEKWKMRAVAKGMANRPDLVASASAYPFDDDHRTELNEIAEQACEAAGTSVGRNLGSAYHKLAQRLDSGQMTLEEVPEAWRADMAARQKNLADNGLRVLPGFKERTGVCPELGVAGTFDSLLIDALGEVFVGDDKTARKIQFGWLGISVQLAIYSRFTHLWIRETKSYESMPKVNLERAIVMHGLVGQESARLAEISIARGWEFAKLADQVRLARNESKRVAFAQPYAPPLAHQVRYAPTVQALSMLWQNHQAGGAWTDHLTELGRQRAAELNGGA